jgi:hypothetical protein
MREKEGREMLIKAMGEMRKGKKILLFGNAAVLLFNAGCGTYARQFMRDWKKATLHPVEFSKEKGKAKTAGYWILNIGVLGAAVEGVAFATGETTPF